MKLSVLIGVSAVAVTGLVAVAVPSSAVSSAQPPALAGCTPHSAVTSVDQGSPIAATSSLIDSAQPLVQTWDYDGTKFFQHIPPAAWNPLTASPAELAYYAIPARPSVSDDLAKWSAEWGPAHYRGISRLDSICSGNPGSARYLSISGANWSGVLDNGVTDYTEAYNGLFEPTTTDPCPSGVAIFNAWSGLGGYYTSNLLQAGVTVGDPSAPGSAGGDVAFWEAINTSAPTNPQYLPHNFINPGDDIHFSTRYDLATGTVLFTWHNYTTGVTYTGGSATINGYPAANYYDGRSAEFIDEQVSGAYVRQYPSANWHNAGVTRSNGAGIAAFTMPHTGLYSDLNGPITQHLNPDSTSGGTDFTNGWRAC